MKQKILWIIGSLLLGGTIITQRLYFPQEYTADRQVWWLIDLLTVHFTTGSIVFPVAGITALFLSKKLKYADRFNIVLPVVFIMLHILFIYSLSGFHTKGL